MRAVSQAAIIGGGIGGLTAGIALAQRGIDAQIFEQAGQITEVGAGLQISPNGMAVLEALGLGPDMARIGVPIAGVEMRDMASGRLLTRLDIRRANFGRPWYGVHRADLINVLAAAVQRAGLQISLGQTKLASDLDAPLVVAADGVKSATRSLITGDGSPEFTQQTAWRALTPGPGFVPPGGAWVQLYLGEGQHLVAYPLRGGSVMNIVAVQEREAWVEESWHSPDDPVTVQEAFSGACFELHRLLADLTDVHRWGLFKRPVAQSWVKGNIALLGDAAHPTLPFLAQGAVMAIEDAWVLAASLAEQSSLGAALTRYQELRRPRCERIVAGADRNARIYHLRGGLARGALHLGLRLGDGLAPGAALRQFDWLYRHDVTG
ncbi:MAG: FAD-dependent monooxygenase [Mangrovicoccus sp.]